MMQWFYNFKISIKVTILSFLLIASTVFIGVMGFYSSYTINQSLKTLNNDRLIPIYDLEEVKSSIQDMRLEVVSHISSTNQIKKANHEAEIVRLETKLLALIDKYSKTYLVDEEITGLDALNKAYHTYQVVRSNVLSLSKNQKDEEASIASNTAGKIAYDNVIATLDNLILVQTRVADQLYNDSERQYNQMVLQAAATILFCIVFGIVLSFIITRAVAVPVRKVTAKLKDISNNGGDLTQRIGLNGNDEIGQLSKAFDLFMEKLQGIIAEVAESSHVIASSSQQLSAATGESNRAIEQIAQTINTIAAGTSDNVAVTQQTTASLNEASRASESTALASKKTNENSLSVREAAEQGAKQVGDIVETIHNISKSAHQVASLISDLDVSSQKISDIVQLITNISGQTNLLALNAAIEAARAGESGRGFNVVAEEIRKLADESSQAAKSIITLVKDNLSKSENAVKSVNQVDEMVSVAVDTVSEVKTNIDSIIVNIQDVVQQVGSINTDIEKQSAITDEITKAMNSIANNANEMAAGTEEVSASVEEQVSTMEEIEATASQLSDMADRLNKITSKFKV